MSEFGEKLRAFREKAGLSPAKIAEIAGIGAAAYYDLEGSGDLYMILSLEEVGRLACALEIKPDDFFFEKNPTDFSKITPNELAKKIQEFIRIEGIDIEIFEER